jgi:Na+/H+-dicarboxylate symporter
VTPPRPASSLGEIASHPAVAVASIVLGLALGRLVPACAAPLALVGDVYIGLSKMVVLPFLFAAVIFSLRKVLRDPGIVTALPRVLLAFCAAYAAAVLCGLASALLVEPGRNLPDATLLAMGRLSDALGNSREAFPLYGTEAASKAGALRELVQALIPVNLFASLAQGDTLKVMSFCLLFGVASGRVHNAGAESFSEILETIYRTCQILIGWFNQFIPLVLFAIMADAAARTGLGPLRAMGKFLLAFFAAALVATALALGALRWASARPLRDVLRSQRDTILMAIATQSSSACMPTMIRGLVEGLGFRRERVELMVPMATALVRVGLTLYLVVAALFLAQLYEVPLGPAQLALLAGAAALTGLASTGTTGVVGIALASGLCASFGIPFEAAFPLFVAVDPLCDVVRTVVLVLMDNAFAAISAGRAQENPC